MHINQLPIMHIASHLQRWIGSCRDFTQLATCEQLITTWIRDRYPAAIAEKYTRDLVGLAQCKHVELSLKALQLMNKQS